MASDIVSVCLPACVVCLPAPPALSPTQNVTREHFNVVLQASDRKLCFCGYTFCKFSHRMQKMVLAAGST